jgi:hypothetical protein
MPYEMLLGADSVVLDRYRVFRADLHQRTVYVRASPEPEQMLKLA